MYYHLDEDIARYPAVLRLITRYADVLWCQHDFGDTASSVVWKALKYDVEQVSSQLRRKEIEFTQYLQRLAYALWRQGKLCTSFHADLLLDEHADLSVPITRSVIEGILESLAHSLWHEERSDVSVAEAFGIDYRSQHLFPSGATIEDLANRVWLALRSGKSEPSLSWDHVTSVALRDGSDSLQNVIDLLRYTEPESVALKRRGQSIAFAHSVFRDIFAASYLSRQLKAGAADDLRLGADMGRYVSELLEGEKPPVGEFDETPDGMGYVPPGPFIAGEGVEFWIRSVSDGFFIGKYQITNYEFEAFVKAGGYECDQWWDPVGLKLRQERDWKEPRSFARERFNAPEQPVVGISSFEAEAYCAWLGERTRRTIRLPNSVEWEKAARGIDGRAYPWGNEEVSSRAATDERTTLSKSAVDESVLEQPLAVGHFSPEGDSPYGLADMAGNAWDWVTVDSEDHAVRGGSFVEPLSEARTANQRKMEPMDRSIDVGFRIVQELPDEDTAPS
jgi:hypothetical protein